MHGCLVQPVGRMQLRTRPGIKSSRRNSLSYDVLEHILYTALQDDSAVNVTNCHYAQSLYQVCRRWKDILSSRRYWANFHITTDRAPIQLGFVKYCIHKSGNRPFFVDIGSLHTSPWLRQEIDSVISSVSHCLERLEISHEDIFDPSGKDEH